MHAEQPYERKTSIALIESNTQGDEMWRWAQCLNGGWTKSSRVARVKVVVDCDVELETEWMRMRRKTKTGSRLVR